MSRSKQVQCRGGRGCGICCHTDAGRFVAKSFFRAEEDRFDPEELKPLTDDELPADQECEKDK